MNYKLNLSEYQILKLFKKYGKYEQKIENLKPKILNNFKKNILNKINLKGNGYLVYVDKALQRSFLIKFDNKKIKIYGYVKVSTGNIARQKTNNGKNKYWETPSIIVEMKKGYWRSKPDIGKEYGGYGKRGSRIFSLNNLKYSNGKFYFTKGKKDIGFAMHKTSFSGKEYLGQKMSHGCIRTEDLMIDILDNIERNNNLDFRYTIIGDYSKNIIPYIPKVK